MVEPAEIVECLVEASSKAQLVPSACFEGSLEMTKQAPSAGESKGHGPKFPQELVVPVQ